MPIIELLEQPEHPLLLARSELLELLARHDIRLLFCSIVFLDDLPRPNDRKAAPDYVGIPTGNTILACSLWSRIASMKKAKGKIIIQAGANVWPHELKTAEALAEHGLTVEFVRRSEEQRAKSADVKIDGVLWEMKAPRSEKPAAIDKNLRKALHQASCVIFDSRRMGKLPDTAVERELRKSASELRSLRHLIFVNRCGQVLDIK